MGWLFSAEWDSPKALARHLRGELEASGFTVLDEASTSYGRHYWALVTRPNTPATIFLALISRGHGGYGYKDMSESAGPCEVDCPLRLLDAAAPPPNDWAAGWRAKVRAYWGEKAASRVAAKGLKPGDRVWLKNTADNPFEIAVHSNFAAGILRGYGASGRLYRLPKTRIERVERADAHVGVPLTV